MAVIEHGIGKNEIVSQLAKSTHGKLAEYVPVGKQAVAQEPEFYAHLIAWNLRKGQVRDSKVALPVINLSTGKIDPEFLDNALAHIAMLNPREFLRAASFAMEIGIPGYNRSIDRLAERYMRARENDRKWWDRDSVQHFESIKTIYSRFRINAAPWAREIIFYERYPKGTIHDLIREMKNMSATEAAGVILEKKVPFLIARGALGAKAKDPDLVLALIGRMSATELVTNSKMLEKLGIKTVPALRAAYEQALQRAASSTKNTLKTAQAVESVADEGLKEKLSSLQEKQIAKVSSINGNWLILADKSGSMSQSIEVARHLAGTLAKMVQGKVWLIFFDTSARYFEVTGKSYEQIAKESVHVSAGGSTSIGCGMQYALDAQLEIDGIAIVSDGGANQPPWFAEVYSRYAKKFDRNPPVYFYKTVGDSDRLTVEMKTAGHDLQVFDIARDVDYYSIPNIAQTMRVSRYSLIDEIFATPLVTLEWVLGRKEARVKREALVR